MRLQSSANAHAPYHTRCKYFDVLIMQAQPRTPAYTDQPQFYLRCHVNGIVMPVLAVINREFLYTQLIDDNNAPAVYRAQDFSKVVDIQLNLHTLQKCKNVFDAVGRRVSAPARSRVCALARSQARSEAQTEREQVNNPLYAMTDYGTLTAHAADELPPAYKMRFCEHAGIIYNAQFAPVARGVAEYAHCARVLVTRAVGETTYTAYCADGRVAFERSIVAYSFARDWVTLHEFIAIVRSPARLPALATVSANNEHTSVLNDTVPDTTALVYCAYTVTPKAATCTTRSLLVSNELF